MMDFLVEFDVNVPEGTPDSEVKDRENAEASAAAKLVNDGHLVRVWRLPVGRGEHKILGLYSAESETELNGLLGALPLYEWMRVVVTALEPHPNDPAGAGAIMAEQAGPNMRAPLPDPRLTKVYRLEATLGLPLDLGDLAQGHRRIVPLTGGTFTGPEIRGKLLAGASADWQIVLPDGTCVRVDDQVGATALRQVMSVLRG